MAEFLDAYAVDEIGLRLHGFLAGKEDLLKCQICEDIAEQHHEFKMC